MGLMDSIQDMLGGDEGRRGYGDFVQRYEQGAPWDGIDDHEAVSRHEEIAGRLGSDEYEEAARESLSRLDPQQREELGQHLSRQAEQHGFASALGGGGGGGGFGDVGALAGMLGGMHRQSPSMLGQLLGGGSGGGGGLGGGLAGKAALAGIAAIAAKKFL